jgi:hypothetical protein
MNMGAARQGFDLFKPHGRRAFFGDLIRRRRFNRLMWRDTFGRVLCWLSDSHVIRQDFENGEVETSCGCCCRWLKQDGYRWVPK